MDFEAAIVLAREVMNRPGWHVISIHHEAYKGRFDVWSLWVRQKRGNMSQYRLTWPSQWEVLRDRLEAARTS